MNYYLMLIFIFNNNYFFILIKNIIYPHAKTIPESNPFNFFSHGWPTVFWEPKSLQTQSKYFCEKNHYSDPYAKTIPGSNSFSFFSHGWRDVFWEPKLLQTQNEYFFEKKTIIPIPTRKRSQEAILLVFLTTAGRVYFGGQNSCKRKANIF